MKATDAGLTPTHFPNCWVGIAVALGVGMAPETSLANPSGGTVSQGSASFSTQGNQFTITTSDKAQINWDSFNIGLGETTTFVQPSASSVVWNHINDSNPSQLLGNLTANGYVILQNSAGFFVGGQASISAHGLVMTTSPIPVPDLASGGSWQFNALPPTASIINYGQIKTDGATGGGIYLIAADIRNAVDSQNNYSGSISAPGGDIGLYAGKQVLLSARSDGRGLSARVTLPQGSVDNEGKLIADAGTIAIHAQTVNQGGLVQANSVRQANGVIELVAGDSLNLEASSVLSAQGDATAGSPSQGGMVVVKAGNTFSDASGSNIKVAGQSSGQDGMVEVFGAGTTASSIKSLMNGQSASDFQSAGGMLLVNPGNITLSQTISAPAGSDPILNLGYLSGFSKIDLFADKNIELSSYWYLGASSDPSARVSLTAGNSISLDDATSISAGQNWSLNLSAGPQNLSSKPAPGTDGIYLNGYVQGGSSLQTQDGDIDLWAANEVVIQSKPLDSTATLNNGIRTLGGGSISVATQFGDVDTGNSALGYDYHNTAPYHTGDAMVGGISTAAGGNVTIAAGGDVRSYLPTSTDTSGTDAGTGAFGNQPGNVTITAGGSVYGHYVVTDGTGTIIANKNAGGSAASDNLALSLTTGAWNVNALHGSINLQEVRNPNGTFNILTAPRGSKQPSPKHLYDYAPNASVTLTAADAVNFLTTVANLPRHQDSPPALFPGSLYVNAGAGGVYLADQVTLFPSAYGELQITTTGGGSLIGNIINNVPVQLLMSDSGSKSWTTMAGTGSFTATDHGSLPLEINNPNPVSLNISGNMETLQLITVKETQVKIGGDMINCSFSGQNLHTTDKTTINVAGQIYNSPSYSSVILTAPLTVVSGQDLPPNMTAAFDSLLLLAVDPALVAQKGVPPNASRSQISDLWGSMLLLSTANSITTTKSGFAYDKDSGKLSFLGNMGSKLLSLLSQPTITVVRFGPDGIPLVDASGHFVTDTYTWTTDAKSLQTLIAESATIPTFINPGLRIGGPGQFNIHADSISLGNSYGILSCGVMDYGELGLGGYQNLVSLTPSGAEINVTANNNIEMLSSTIASLGGGNVNIRSENGEIDLGEAGIPYGHRILPLGAYTTGLGDISVSAYKDVNIDGSRVATYDGGSITVHSDTGNVNAGSGGATAAGVELHYIDPVTGKAASTGWGAYGSGILAVTMLDPTKVSGSPTQPGNILVTTPQGSIYASQGGILQEALSGSILPGPTLTLIAGTMPTAENGYKGYNGDIDVKDSGVIGGTLIISANGKVNGLLISQQSSTVTATGSIGITLLAGGTASVSSTSGSVTGTIVGVTGANVNAADGVTAQVLSQSANVNGSTSSTLGTSATATATSTAASATSTSEAREQTSGTTTAQNDDDLQKHKKQPVLTRRVGRVTVLLPRI